MYERTEVETVVLGLRIVESWGDPELSRNAATALAKVEAALPGSRRGMVRETRLFAPTHSGRPAVGIDLALLRGRCGRAAGSGSSAATARTARPAARSGPWASPSSARSGCSPPGASCGTTAGASAWSASRLDLLDEGCELEQG